MHLIFEQLFMFPCNSWWFSCSWFCCLWVVAADVVVVAGDVEAVVGDVVVVAHVVDDDYDCIIYDIYDNMYVFGPGDWLILINWITN